MNDEEIKAMRFYFVLCLHGCSIMALGSLFHSYSLTFSASAPYMAYQFKA